MAMNKDYQSLVAALDNLNTAELVALIYQISIRLQTHVGVPDDESADDEPVDSARRYLPRLAQMIAWGLIVPMEDTLYVRDIPNQPALLLDDKRVAYQGMTMSLNDWAKKVTSWKAVNIYEWVIIKRNGRTLDEVRRAYMSENGIE